MLPHGSKSSSLIQKPVNEKQEMEKEKVNENLIQKPVNEKQEKEKEKVNENLIQKPVNEKQEQEKEKVNENLIQKPVNEKQEKEKEKVNENLIQKPVNEKQEKEKEKVNENLIQKPVNEKQEKEKEKEEKSKWTHLPSDVMELVMRRLCLRDYLALRTICSPWRSTVTNAIANKHCFPLPELPLVVFLSTEQSFFSLRTEREYCPNRSLIANTGMTGMTFHGSVEGWMIISNYKKNDSLSFFFFFNPATNHTVPVPSPLYFQDKKPLMGKMVVSSTPDYCNKSDCFLAGNFLDGCQIAFYRLFDKSWNMIEAEKDSEDSFLELEIIGSKLYVVTFNAYVVVYDLKDFSNGSPKPNVLGMVPQASTPYIQRIIDNQCHVSGLASCFLAKHETLEQLFLIYVIWDAVYKSEDVNNLNMATKFVIAPEITEAEVFKLDMNSEPIDWIKCESLDDNVVFVSSYKNMVMSTQESLRGNSFYFALSFRCHTDPWQGIRFGVKDLTDSSIKYFSPEKSNHSKVPLPAWFKLSI